MSENECNHWHHQNADDTVYCRDCKEILAVEPYWWGTIAIGLMENTFERIGNSLDLTDLIMEFLGVNRITLSTVRISTGENAWKTMYFVTFLIGNQPMVADIYAVRGDHYNPTGLKFVEEAVVE
jgi:hypothetical protein